MADLAPAALEFLRKYLGYDTRGFLAKKRLRGQMEKFWRRKEKTEAEVKALPPDHPRLAEFKKALTDAENTAKTGALKQAYSDLDAVKIAARAEADTVKDGVNAQTLLADLLPLQQKCQTLRTLAAQAGSAVATRAVGIEARLDGLPKAVDGTDRDDILTRAGRAMALRNELKGELTALDQLQNTSKDTFTNAFDAAPASQKTIERARHNAGLLQDQGKLTMDLNGKLQFVEATFAELKMDKRPGPVIQPWADRAAACRKTVEETLAAAIALPDMDEAVRSTDDSGKRIDEGELPDFGDNEGSVRASIARFEKENEARIEAARERMRRDANWDYYNTEMHPTASPDVVPSRVAPFDTSSVIDTTTLGYDPRASAVTKEQFAGDAADKLAEALSGQIDAYTSATAGSRKIPDEVLEVACRTTDQWCEEIAKGMGLAWDPGTMDAGLVDKIKAAATAMQAKAAEVYPDRSTRKDNGEIGSFTMGGITYDDVKVLGQGGGGRVYLAKSADGREVVIKEPLPPEDEDEDLKSHDELVDEMATEILTHRSITGGETDPCDDNLLEHKGMVLSPDGVPLAVMDLADAGDADEFNNTMAAVSGTVISESARQALVAAQMRDVLKGVKAMHDQGYSHFDLKQLNVFMMKDGTYKVADFGMAQKADTRDATLKGKFQGTADYVAPEVGYATGDIDMRADNFSLGAMLMRAVSPTGRHEEVTGGRDRNTHAGNVAPLDEKGKAVEVSASSRLIAGLMADDPGERLSVETALASSYFDDVEREIDPAAIDRLRKASAEYAASVGRLTAKYDKQIIDARAAIRKYERMKSGEAKEDVFRAAEVAKVRKTHEKERWQKILAELSSTAVLAQQNAAKIKEIETAISDLDESIERATRAVDAIKANPDLRAFSETDAQIKHELAAAREKLKEAEAAATRIREDPKFADVTRELAEASAAFR